MSEPFDAWKASQLLPPVPDSHRRIWLHLFPNQDHLAAWIGRNGGNSEHFNDPWEPGAYTDDHDDIYASETAWYRNVLEGTSVVGVVQHEGRHIYIGPESEAGLPAHEHHDWWHFMVCAGHGVRLFDGHHAGFDRALARLLVAEARQLPPDADGVRHAYINVPECEIHGCGGGHV